MAVYGICEAAPGRLLLARAAPRLTVRGRWFLPGGGLEHGEDPVTGLRREFAEESGLMVGAQTLRGVLSDTSVLPDGTDLHTVRIIFGVDRFEGDLRAEACGSTDAVRWFTPAERAQAPVMPYVTEALQRFGGGRAGA